MQKMPFPQPSNSVVPLPEPGRTWSGESWAPCTINHLVSQVRLLLLSDSEDGDREKEKTGLSSLPSSLSTIQHSSAPSLGPALTGLGWGNRAHGKNEQLNKRVREFKKTGRQRAGGLFEEATCRLKPQRGVGES